MLFKPRRVRDMPHPADESRVRHLEDSLTRISGVVPTAASTTFGRNAAASAGQVINISGGSGGGGGGSGGGGGGSPMLGGDVTGPAVSNTVGKLQGTPLTLTAPTLGQLIAFNGTAYVNTSTISGPLTVTGLLTAGEIKTGAFFDVKANGEIDANGSAGTAGQVLSSNGPGASASWVAAGGGGSLASLSDVSLSGTAQGDVLYRGASFWDNLPAGTAGFVLTTGGPGANPTWTPSSSGTLAGLGDVSLAGVAQGDLLYRGATQWNNLGHGTAGQFLETQGAAANPTWASLPADTDSLATLTDVSLSGTAQGDVLFRGATTWNNLGHGTAGQVLTTQGAAANPSWTTASSGGNITSATAYGSEPGSPTTGDLDFYTNGISVARWSGSAWLPWGRLNELTTPPLAASLTSVNVTTATLVDNAGSRFLNAPDISASHGQFWVKTLASGAYTWITHLETWLISATFTAGGLALRDSAGGKIITFEQSVFSSTLNLNVTQWSDANTRVSNPLLKTMFGKQFNWFKIHDDGTTNRTYSVSHDGINWLDVLVEGRTTFLGVAPNQAGIVAVANGAAVGLGVYSWVGA